MGILNVALLQMIACGNDQDANLAKGEEYCRRAARAGADVALLPEMWNIGYASGFNRDLPDYRAAWNAQAVGPQDSYVLHFRQLARELGMAIGLTYLERWPEAPRNTVSLIDRAGQIVLTYAKVHTCDFFAMESCCTPGDGFPVSTLETAAGPVRVGAMICHDREQPEAARVLMLNGAEVILTPNACGLEDRQIDQFRARAFENALVVAMANYASPHVGCNGRSVAYDAESNLIVMAGKYEGVYIAPIDLDGLRAYRARTFWGNAYRRPHRYGPLTSTQVTEPWQRIGGLGEPWHREQR
jgi:N-carbamoylputrescine amidase